MAKLLDADKLRDNSLTFSFHQRERSLVEYIKIFQQPYLEKVKSLLIAECRNFVQTWIPSYLSIIAQNRISYTLKQKIAGMDNQGYSRMDASEISAQLGNLLPLNENVEWPTNVEIITKLKQADPSFSDFIVPVYVHSAGRTRMKMDIENLKTFIKTCRKITEKEEKHFVDQYQKELIQRIAMVHPVLDCLLHEGLLTQEQYDVVKDKDISQEKMRFLYLFSRGWSIPDKNIFYRALKTSNPGVIEHLEGTSISELDLYGSCDEEEKKRGYNADIQLDTETLTIGYESLDSENPHSRYDLNISEIPCKDPVVSSSAFQPETELYDEEEDDLYGMTYTYGNSSQNTQPGDMKPFTYLSPVTKSSSGMGAKLSEKDGLKKWVDIKKAKAWEFNADDGTWYREQSPEKEQDREVTTSKYYIESDEYRSETFTLDYESPDSETPHPRYDLNISEIPCRDPIVSSSAFEHKTQLYDEEEHDLYGNSSQNTQTYDMKPFTYLSPVTESSSGIKAKLSETNSPKELVNPNKTKAWKLNERDGKWYREQSPERVQDKKAAKPWRFDASDGKWHGVDN